MSTLSDILDNYRNNSVTEREKGTYFEELIVCYLRNEASYKDLYSDVWTYGEWARLQGLNVTLVVAALGSCALAVVDVLGRSIQPISLFVGIASI